MRGHPWIYRSEVTEAPSGARAGAGARSARAIHRPGTLLTRAPRSGCGCWSGATGRWTRPGGGSISRPRARSPERHRRHRLPARPRRGRRHSRRSWWTATTAGSWSRSSPPDSRPCGTPIVAALSGGPEPEGILLRNDAPVRRREGLSPESPSSRTGRCRARSRCARAACAISPPPGTGRRPAPSSISGPIACSPASSRPPAGERSTASPTTAPSRCTWLGARRACWRST